MARKTERMREEIQRLILKIQAEEDDVLWSKLHASSVTLRMRLAMAEATLRSDVHLVKRNGSKRTTLSTDADTGQESDI